MVLILNGQERSGRFGFWIINPDSRANFKGLWDQLPPSEFQSFIPTSAERKSYFVSIIPLKIILSIPLQFL